MKILAFETSCDDTSVAVFEDDKLLFMDTKSQIKIHNETWWVVPEVAAREHANSIFLVLENVLKKTCLKLEDFDYIACTTNPWLLPSILTWTTVASSISTILKIPIIPINHIEAHIFSNFLEREESEINFPLACLTVSGWHNEIYKMNSLWEKEKLWGTSDDAAWEAFDKIAKMMGLWYPWGPIISKLASEYTPPSVPPLTGEGSQKKTLWTMNYELWTNLFPRVWLVKREFNFSFSGLKSAVKREVDKRISENWKLSLEDQREISFEAEEAITEVLAWKLAYAAEKYNLKTIMLAWWVSANNKLKDKIQKVADEKNLKFIYPKKIEYCMDNAAMIWILAYYRIKYGKFEEKVWVLEI